MLFVFCFLRGSDNEWLTGLRYAQKAAALPFVTDKPLVKVKIITSPVNC